jgi:DNA ligase-associated metallophosphoesterase
MVIALKEQTFRLLHQRAVFWEEEDCLIISDLHLGKSRHFRKGGIPLPGASDAHNLCRLRSMLDVLHPSQLLLLGDFFHSVENNHVREVAGLLDSYPAITKRLVLGNHDIMDRTVYEELKLEIFDDSLQLGPFCFTHEPRENSHEQPDDETYTISGHIHPGVHLKGKGKQRITLPCFYFGARQAILPAFGNFTGLYRITPNSGDRIYAITQKAVLALT